MIKGIFNLFKKAEVESVDSLVSNFTGKFKAIQEKQEAITAAAWAARDSAVAAAEQEQQRIREEAEAAIKASEEAVSVIIDLELDKEAEARSEAKKAANAVRKLEAFFSDED